MISRRLLTSALLLTVLAVVSLVAASAKERRSDSEQDLLARIEREQDPVRKSKLELRLGRLKMQQALDAYGEGRIDQGKSLLDGYLDRVKSCWQTLKGSGRNAVKQPQGFRELDIALREDGRTLEDMSKRISYFDREPVEQTMQQMNHVHDEVLHALFPSLPVAPEKPAPAPPSKTGEKGDS
ncbi:MAG TPA: hypothetical protein VKM93_08240 [Terriglobia bacterium]|nr:hypothetical protein [Terriglobia bacterium]